jgi:hypothetical protein
MPVSHVPKDFTKVTVAEHPGRPGSLVDACPNLYPVGVAGCGCACWQFRLPAQPCGCASGNGGRRPSVRFAEWRPRQSLRQELASRIATCPLSNGPLFPLHFFHLLTRQAKIIQQMVVEPAQLIVIAALPPFPRLSLQKAHHALSDRGQ